MGEINFNKILERELEETVLYNSLKNFVNIKKDITKNRGFYIYGNPGVGKTEFVKKILNELDYDIIYYDASDIRNKNMIESITNHNIGDTNIMSLFQKKKRNIAIVMDEIDGLSNGDKTSLSILIKLIRGKKTKKQKLEDITMNPIIFIGNYQTDKKIKELIKFCTTIELKQPSKTHIKEIITKKFFRNNKDKDKNQELIEILSENIDGDLRKVKILEDIYNKNTYTSLLTKENIPFLFQKKIINEDTKNITKKLLNNKINFNEHSYLINETDRTSISLLFHENIVDILQNYKNEKKIPFYLEILDNYSYFDYIDRITFQKQIWIYNEISSLMKIIHNNNLLFDNFSQKKYNPKEVRFTKILTKYSTEYNNQLFIQNLTNILHMDKNDLLSYFQYLRQKHSEEEILQIFDNYDINKLDIQRFIRFIDNIHVDTTE